MKITFNQLSSSLSKKLAPIYLISGDEPLLVEETFALIRQSVMDTSAYERISIPIEPGVDWGKIFFAHSQTLSLFSNKRLLELDLSMAKLTAVNCKILQEFAEHPHEDTVLLIRTNKLDKKAEQSGWYKAIDKIGIIVTIWPIATDQLPTWVTQRAKTLGLTLSKNAAELLAERVEGNLLAAAQALEKLNLLKINETIDAHTIEEILEDHAHFDIFNLVDSVLAGNAKRCLRIVDNLAAEETEPTLVLWALTREIRTMSELLLKMKEGEQLNSLFSQYRIWEKRQPSVRAFVKRHSQENCWQFLLKAAEIDRIIKGAEAGNSWNAIKEWVLLPFLKKP